MDDYSYGTHHADYAKRHMCDTDSLRKIAILCIFAAMRWDDTLYAFVHAHREDDVHELVLQAARYPEVDVALAAEQIAIRRRLRHKLPQWVAHERIIFPSSIAAEQCSSAETASYKQRLVHATDVLCDLTGGMGVDSYFFARKAAKVIYVERNEAYCEAARHNFACVGVDNIDVLTSDAQHYISHIETMPDVLYIDPARRDGINRRMVDLQDCEPNVLELSEYWTKIPTVILKLSPMLDISRLLSVLSHVAEIHVVSVHNDCQELLEIGRAHV